MIGKAPILKGFSSAKFLYKSFVPCGRMGDGQFSYGHANQPNGQSFAFAYAGNQAEGLIVREKLLEEIQPTEFEDLAARVTKALNEQLHGRATSEVDYFYPTVEFGGKLYNSYAICIYLLIDMESAFRILIPDYKDATGTLGGNNSVVILANKMPDLDRAIDRVIAALYK